MQDSLARSLLTAPFDGIISAVPVSEGEWVADEMPIVELIDVSRWHVDTKNVGELQIARVREGQKATVRVNAFQDEALRGHVATVSPVAVVQQGDTTYTLTIELEDTDLNLDHIQPTTVLGCVMKLQSVQNAFRFRRVKSFVKCCRRMRVQVVQHDHDAIGFRAQLIDKILHAMGKVDLGTLFCDPNVTPTS